VSYSVALPLEAAGPTSRFILFQTGGRLLGSLTPQSPNFSDVRHLGFQ